MAKKQTRRGVSLSGEVHDRATETAAMLKKTCSEWVTDLIVAELARRGERPLAIPRAHQPPRVAKRAMAERYRAGRRRAREERAA